MAQVPAVPKLTRARHLLRSTLFGRINPTADMVASERAALRFVRRACTKRRPNR